MIAREEARLRALFEKLLRSVAVASLGSLACACSSSGDDAAGPTDAGAKDATIAAHDSSIDEPIDACSDHFEILDAPGDGSNCEYTERLGCGLPEYIREGRDASRLGCLVYLGICYGWCPAYGAAVANCTIVECDDAGNVSPGPVTIDCVNEIPRCSGIVGRRPSGLRAPSRRFARDAVGAWLASSARHEAASVRAFRDLGAELVSLGAPRALVACAARSARDEVRHARAMSQLSRARGARPARAIVTPRRRVRGAREPSRAARLLDLALENAVEGCVRETFGALVATRQAARARDPRLASTMKRIAEDETRHAALAWAIARWVDRELDDDARAEIETARRAAVDALRCEVTAMDARVALEVGAPSGVHGAALVDALAAAHRV